MSNPLRDRDPSLYRLITIRTEEGRLWMTPNKLVRKTIGGVVARYQQILGVEIYAACVLSNHSHLIARAPRSNIDEFCENVDREIARRINWLNNRRGSFWDRRYSDQKIVTERDLLEAFLYVTTNAVKHSLVEHPRLWPGFNSYHQSISEKEERYLFHHHSAAPDEPQATEHIFRLSPLPQFAELTPRKRKREVRALIDERTQHIVAEHKEAARWFLGVRAVQSQNPSSTPLNISRSPRGVVYSKDPKVIREQREVEYERRTHYSDASMRYRAGESNIEFPKFTFRPPLHRKPRLFPFQPLPDGYFQKAA